MYSLQPTPNRLSFHSKTATDLLMRNAVGLEGLNFLKDLVPADRSGLLGWLREASRSTHSPGTMPQDVIWLRAWVKFGRNSLRNGIVTINQGEKGI